MFSLQRPSAATIAQRIEAASGLTQGAPRFLTARGDVEQARLPFFFVRDRSTSCIGRGEGAFLAAKHAMTRWLMFELGWVRVANPNAVIVLGQIVAVEAHTLGLWTLNLSRIVDVVDQPGSFGFVYATTADHAEEGEERFLASYSPATKEVFYSLEAVSRPRAGLARLGLPFTRSFQHRFARESHQRMRKAVQEASL